MINPLILIYYFCDIMHLAVDTFVCWKISWDVDLFLAILEGTMMMSHLASLCLQRLTNEMNKI